MMGGGCNAYMQDCKATTLTTNRPSAPKRPDSPSSNNGRQEHFPGRPHHGCDMGR